MWYLAPGRPKARATVDEMRLANMQAINACHQFKPKAMRLAPLDHWLELKALPHQ